jgi:membrane protease YdiL (CAAX protease family)
MNPTGTVTRPEAAAAAMAGVVALFVARPLLPGGTAPLVALFGLLLLVGAAWPVATDAGPAAAVLGPLVVGVAAFLLVRALGVGLRMPVGPRYATAIVLAPVAEELFFRRFVYGVLRPGGVALAIGGSTVLFAVAHVTVYGWWVLPLDLAAGLILGWQRWASGTWVVPAATHVVANLLIVL